MEELRRRIQDRPLYFSVSTLSAMQIASQRIRPLVDGMFYFPLDLWWPARRILTRIAPCLMVFIETDIWPGFQHQLRRSATRAVLVNGRLSPDSYAACLKFRSLFAPALNSFLRLYPQSTTEAQRYREVGVAAAKLGRPGNLKFDVALRTPPAGAVATLRERLGLSAADPVLVAGSTHPGEEAEVLKAFARVRGGHPEARLILVPRHPSRSEHLLAQVNQSRWNAKALSDGDGGQPWDVMVVDVMGILSTLYHLATVSFVGGSLVNKGGQNPLESAAAGCPVFFGPDMSDFPDIAEWLVQGGAAFEVSSGSGLGERWLALMNDDAECERIRKRCRRIIEEHQGATALIADEIVGWITADKSSGA
jgi:3-deoxy-D-manno-octulosonic-acid transferase